MVDGDPESLTRLVWILVDNAMRHGAGEVEIGLAVDQAGRRAELTVADRGPGIPSGDEERIFERFHQADGARSGDGAGLGLAIAATIVEAHDGRVSAEQRVGGGALFRVDLPLFAG